MYRILLFAAIFATTVIRPVSAQSHFSQCSSITGSSASAIIPSSSSLTIDGDPLPAGSEIAAFTSDGLCAGAVEWEGTGLGFALWRNNAQTAEIDGFIAGDSLHFRIWDASTDQEYRHVEVKYGSTEAFFDVSGHFSPDALYEIAKLEIIIPPAPPLLASPSDGASEESLTTTLSWNEAPGAASYTVELATEMTFQQPLVEVGTSVLAATTPQLSHATTYYWRVRAQNSAGTGDWSAVRSFTTVMPSSGGGSGTTPQTPASPTLLSPADADADQSTSPTLDWSESEGALTYELQVADSEEFATLLYDIDGLADTSYELDGLNEAATYFWRARASNAAGPGEWSAAQYFVTRPPVPSSPELASPANGAADLPTSIQLAWGAVPYADTYDVQVSTDVEFIDLLLQSDGLTTTELTVNGLDRGITYFWRIRSVNATGASPWTAPFEFRTVHRPIVPPVPASPSDGAVDLVRLVTLEWTDEAEADLYTVQVSDDSLFNRFTNQTNVTSRSFKTTSLKSSETYFWRVRGSYPGGLSEWSVVFKFKTQVAPPETPRLTTPSNGAVQTSPIVLLAWTGTANAHYRIQIAADSAFSSIVHEVPSSASSSFSFTGPNTPAVYFWRISAENSAGSSDWSDVYRFTVAHPKPAASPTMVSPDNHSVTLDTTVALRWASIAEASSYHVRLYEVIDDVSLELRVDSAGIDTNEVSLALNPGSGYAWFVRAENSAGPGPWSTMWWFETPKAVETSSQDEHLPDSFGLHQNYPNPFNPSTTIPFDVPSTGDVRIEIFNALGARVALLLSQTLPAGSHEVRWSAGDLPSGTYVCRLLAGRQVQTRVLLLIK